MRKITQLLPALAWALAIIAVAFVFKGTPAALPIVAAVTGVGFIVILPKNRKPCC